MQIEGAQTFRSFKELEGAGPMQRGNRGSKRVLVGFSALLDSSSQIVKERDVGVVGKGIGCL